MMTQSGNERRKLAAIMFTDMVGYSALTQKNEKLALELLDEHRKLLRPVFPKHSGREIETAGDAFFVEFGSALEAARCAIEIQERLFERNRARPPERAITIRIGLHLGDVVYMDKHVHGDGVNIAARIEPLAEPGGVCISEDVARQIQNKIELPVVRMGKGELKNIQLSMDIYRIVMPWEKNQSAVSARLKFVLRRRKMQVLAATALLALLIIGLLFLLPTKSVMGDKNSIAVLPWENLSDSKEDVYFSDGITMDIIAKISKLQKLNVTSPTTVALYRYSDKDAKTIARELNVAYLLGGKVRRTPSKIHIVAFLTDAITDHIKWTETYDNDLTEIWAIQSDVAKKIAAAMEVAISPDEETTLEKKSTENLDAYDLYLKGRYFWNKRRPDDLQKGIDYFQQALKKDPHYALAFAGLADSYIILGDFNILPPREAYPKATDAATKALVIDSGLAEVHTSLAYSLMHYNWDWSGAEREFRRAIELNPRSPQAHSWYALFLSVRGRFDDAAAEGDRALQLDSLAATTRTDIVLALYYARKYDQVLEQCSKVLQIDPSFLLVELPRGGAYIQKGMYADAVKSFSTLSVALAMVTSKGHPIPVAALGYAYAVSGQKDDAVNMLELLQTMTEGGEYVSPYWMAAVYTGLHNKDEAFRLLQKAYEEHDGLLVFLKVDPIFDPLHTDARFRSLLGKVGLDTGS